MSKAHHWQFAMVGGVLLAWASHAVAQWSGDPGSPLIVAGGAGDQGVPVIRPTIDGGAWIAFMDNAAGSGYKPTIQRLTSIGQAAFAGNGIVLANRHNTATFVFDMKVDASGNAIVAFDDDSSGTSLVTVQKVLPDGSLPWGTLGIQMPGSAGAIGPRVTPCADGSSVCAWQITSGSAATLYYRRIDANGSLPAGGAWTYTDTSDTGHYLAFSDLQSGNSGNDFIALWIRGHIYNATNSSKGLQAQKFGAANVGVWNSGLPVDVAPYARPPASPTHSIQNGYFPSLIADGLGGVVVGWYDIGTNREDRFQHIRADGTLRFGPDAMTPATTPGELQLAGGVDYDRANDEFVIAFERSNGLQSLFGLGVQRVDSAGARLFGPAGGVILPTTGSHSAFINAIAGPARSTYVVWSQYQGANGPMQIKATRLDASGTPIWTSAIVDVANSSSNKSRLGAFAASGGNRVICAWNDGTSGANDVLAGNLNFDGSLGAPMCIADLDDDGVLSNGGNPDGGVEINDLLFFVAAFENGSILADLDNGSGTGTQDGGVEISDLLYFLFHFEAGC
jgi:hypothetical protein